MPCTSDTDKIGTANVFFYYAYSHLQKYGWACPSRNGIRIQSDITVSASNIHKGASGSHQISENHNAYTRLTRFRAESLYWMAFVLYVSVRATTRALFPISLFSHQLATSIAFIQKITIHLYRLHIGVAFFLFLHAFPNVISCYKAHFLHLYTKRKTGNMHRYISWKVLLLLYSFHLRTK